MKFCWCTIQVRNMEESLKFYKEIVRLEENRRFNAGPNMEIVFLGSGETQVELIYNKSKDGVYVGQDISLGFEVESVENMMTTIKDKGLSIHSGPFEPAPNVKFFYVLDPNGVKIQFVENK